MCARVPRTDAPIRSAGYQPAVPPVPVGSELEESRSMPTSLRRSIRTQFAVGKSNRAATTEAVSTSYRVCRLIAGATVGYGCRGRRPRRPERSDAATGSEQCTRLDRPAGDCLLRKPGCSSWRIRAAPTGGAERAAPTRGGALDAPNVPTLRPGRNNGHGWIVC